MDRIAADERRVPPADGPKLPFDRRSLHTTATSRGSDSLPGHCRSDPRRRSRPRAARRAYIACRGSTGRGLARAVRREPAGSDGSEPLDGRTAPGQGCIAPALGMAIHDAGDHAPRQACGSTPSSLQVSTGTRSPSRLDRPGRSRRRALGRCASRLSPAPIIGRSRSPHRIGSSGDSARSARSPGRPGSVKLRSPAAIG